MPERAVYENAYIISAPSSIANYFLVDVMGMESLILISRDWITAESEVRNVGDIGKLVLDDSLLLSKEERNKARIARIREVIQTNFNKLNAAKETYDTHLSMVKKYQSFLPPSEKDTDAVAARFELLELG